MTKSILHRNRGSSARCYYPPLIKTDRPNVPLSSHAQMQDSDIIRGAAMIRKTIQDQLLREEQAELEQHQSRHHQYGGLLTQVSTQEPEDLYDFSFEENEAGGASGKHKKGTSYLDEEEEGDDNNSFDGIDCAEDDREIAHISHSVITSLSHERNGKVSPTQRDEKEVTRGDVYPKRHVRDPSVLSDAGSRTTATSSPPPPPPPAEDSEHTPISYMGRGKSLRMKTHTYFVESFEVEDDSSHDTYDFVEDDYIDEDIEDEDVKQTVVPMPSKRHVVDGSPSQQDQKNMLPYAMSPDIVRTPKKLIVTPTSSTSGSHITTRITVTDNSNVVAKSAFRMSPTPPSPVNTSVSSINTSRSSQFSLDQEKQSAPVTPSPVSRQATYTIKYIGVVSPLAKAYNALLQDQAYLHAQNAGTLWQSIVGHQLRFPTQWWNGQRAAPLGCEKSNDQKWEFVGRYPVRDEDKLKRVVKNRSSAGRLLLHIIVQDTRTFEPVMDIVVGVFHPNARGIRRSSIADPYEEDCRDVWLAVRQRVARQSRGIGILEPFLCLGQVWTSVASRGPLGPKQRVSNVNVRCVFGDQPPLETVIESEHALYECLSNTLHSNPPMTLLHEYKML